MKEKMVSSVRHRNKEEIERESFFSWQNKDRIRCESTHELTRQHRYISNERERERYRTIIEKMDTETESERKCRPDHYSRRNCAD